MEGGGWRAEGGGRGGGGPGDGERAWASRAWPWKCSEGTLLAACRLEGAGSAAKAGPHRRTAASHQALGGPAAHPECRGAARRLEPPPSGPGAACGGSGGSTASWPGGARRGRPARGGGTRRTTCRVSRWAGLGDVGAGTAAPPWPLLGARAARALLLPHPARGPRAQHAAPSQRARLCRRGWAAAPCGTLTLTLALGHVCAT